MIFLHVFDNVELQNLKKKMLPSIKIRNGGLIQDGGENFFYKSKISVFFFYEKYNFYATNFFCQRSKADK
jgi:hypothetical protein